MLRSILPLGTVAHQRTDTNSKLLELSDRDVTIEETPPSTEQEAEEPAPDPLPNLASVITQVDSAAPEPAAPAADREDHAHTGISWRSRFRY
jgi:hypothetical protein